MAIIRILIMSITLRRLHVALRIRNWSCSLAPPCTCSSMRLLLHAPAPPYTCSITSSLFVPGETPSSPASLALVAFSGWLHLFIITIFTLFCCHHQVSSGFRSLHFLLQWPSVNQQLLALSSPHYSVKKNFLHYQCHHRRHHHHLFTT